MIDVSVDVKKFCSLERTNNLLDNNSLIELFKFFYEIYDDQIETYSDIYLSNVDFRQFLNILDKLGINYQKDLEVFCINSLDEMLQLYRKFYNGCNSADLKRLLSKFANRFLFGFTNLTELVNLLQKHKEKLNIKNISPTTNINSYTIYF